MMLRTFGGEDTYVVVYIVTAAGILYARMWKDVEVPELEMLIKKVMEVVEMDVLAGGMKDGDVGRVQRKWEKFCVWLERR